MIHASGWRWATRLTALALVIAAIWASPLPAWTLRILPGLSPWTALHASLAQREQYLPLVWAVPPLILMLAAMARGRWFCRWLCPTGTIYAVTAMAGWALPWRRRPRPRSADATAPGAMARPPRRRMRWNAVIFWTLFAGALLGGPLWLFLDPLATASRAAAYAAGRGVSWVAWAPGLVLLAFIGIGLFRPMTWCAAWCPLGYTFDLLHAARRPKQIRFDPSRREFLAAGAGLAALALGLPRATWGRPRADPVLPPGALPAREFAAVCSRCYACVRACPSGVLRVDPRADRTWAQLAQPEMNADRGACDEYCRECQQVCPTGAIRPQSEDQKRACQIGVARIDRAACLAWADHEYCMVCDEYCPYNAVDTDMDPAGIPRPVVNPAACRGCGFCQLNCPAIRAGKAIRVVGQPRAVFLVSAPP
jgi:ferredoxin